MKEQFKLDNQLCFRLYTASRLLTQAYHPLLSEHGLTYPQYLVLMVLWEKDAQPVAKRLMLETNTVTPLLKRMELQGILTRSKGSADARQVIITLTEKGQNLQNLLADVPMKVGSAVICKSVTPDTVPALFGMLDDIIAKLDNQTNRHEA